jgi:acetyl esterase/lipase
MRTSRCISIAAGALVLVGGAAPARPDDVRVEEGIIYATHGGEELQLDIAAPAGGTLRPAVLFIHGGGWARGKRQAYSGAIREAARKGYVAATVSYRFAPKHPWPAQLEDVRAALRWLRSNAEKYGIDPGRIAAGGMSAGGHLSLMLGLRPEGLEGEEAGIAAVVNYFGPTDMTVDQFNDFVDGLLEGLAGGKREEKAAAYRDFSPVTHISAGDAPVLTFQGTEDPLVPDEQARTLHAALDKARIPNRLEILEGRGHGWAGEDMERTERRAFEFLDAYLKGSGLPLLLAEDFREGGGRWEPTDPSAWKVETRDGGKRYSLFKKQSDYRPPFRSPVNLSILGDIEVEDFVLDVKARSTTPDYGHRDVCIVFGHVDPGHYYYVHLAKEADDRANSIFIVNGKDRASIAGERTKGTAWDEAWHRVRVRRDAASGTIEVFFDDLEKPVMRATDRTFPRGRIGLGSFDDTADFAEVRLRGNAVKR